MTETPAQEKRTARRPAATSATEATPSIVTLLSRVMEDIGAVGKDGFNTNQKYNFRGIDAVVNATSPVLRAHGVIVLPHLVSLEHEATSAKSGGGLTITRVVVDYTFHGPAGDSLTVRVPGEAMDSGDKSTPKAMSVAFRIALLQALALPTDDADPDSQSYERSAPGTSRAQAAVSGDAHYARATTAIDTAVDKDFLARLRSTVEQFDRDGTFTPEQAGILYERIEARAAALDAEKPGA